MYENQHEQTKYNNFLKALRIWNEVSQRCVCKGICTPSGMNRFELGSRMPEKLIRDRLTARMGISCERFEDYLQPKDYVKYRLRQEIVTALEKEDLETAKVKLADYEAQKGLTSVHKQFVEAMRYMILSFEGAKEEVLFASITSALNDTVLDVEKALTKKQLLSPQEVNLILEQVRFMQPPNDVTDADEWRFAEYEKLILYIENSKWEKLLKVKIYPRVVNMICQLLLEKEFPKDRIRRGIELCENAIGLLKDTNRAYYLAELLEAKWMMSEGTEFKNVGKRKSKKLDFCYLYYENDCYNIVEVIEKRRNMLGLSRVRLSEGICTDKTIIRFEREGVNPSMTIVRFLFERMGMCPEYRRAEIVTTDIEVFRWYHNDLVKCVKEKRFEEALACISTVKERINMDLPYNKQGISRVESYILFLDEKIDTREFVQKIKEAFECTIEFSALKNTKEKFLTHAEWMCVYHLAYFVDFEVSQICLDVLLEKDKNNKK